MDNLDGFNPEIHLERAEQSALASIVAQPGFAVLQKICRACVDSFVVSWINKDTEEEVIRAHSRAKVSAQFYTLMLNHINEQVDAYVHDQPQTKPLDVTENLDIGEYTDPDNPEEEEPLF
jgi:hypothetical protein